MAGRGGGARGRASRGVGYVVTSAREREREEPTRLGLGDGVERASEGGCERAFERGGERRPLVPERPRTALGVVGERSREGKKKGRERSRTEAGGGGRGRRRSWRRAGAEGVSERSGRAREGRGGKGGGHAGARARTGSALGGEWNWIGFAASGVSFGRHFTTAPLAPDTGSSEHAFPATRSPRTGFFRRSPTGR